MQDRSGLAVKRHGGRGAPTAALLGLIGSFLALPGISFGKQAASADADDGVDASSARRLDQIQISARGREESRFDVPQATTVVEVDRTSVAVPQTSMDLLRGQTGTFLQQTTPGQAAVIVRGLKGSEVLHLVDGFRLNNAFFRNAPNQYIALVDSLLLERVEVVRGPGGTLYGSDAMGGVVQMISRRPDWSEEGWQSSTSLRSHYSSVDSASHSRLAAAASSDTLALSAGLSYQDVDLRRAGGGERLPFTDFTARAGNASLRWRSARSHAFDLQVQHLVQPATPRHDELVAGFGQSQPNAAVFLFAPQSRRFVQARWHWQAALPFLDDMTMQTGRQTLVDGRRIRDLGSPFQDEESNRSTLSGASLHVQKHLGDHHIAYGLEHYADRVDSRRSRTDLASGMTAPRPGRFPDGARMRSSAAWLAHDWQPPSALSVGSGLRWNRAEVDLPGVDGLGVSIRPRDLSGHASLLWRAGENLHAVANLGRGFRAPNVFDLGTFGDRPGNRFNLPNPELASETVDSIDLGLKWSSPRLEAELFGFASRYRDKISAIPTGGTTEGGRVLVQNRNLAALELHGVEGGLRLFPTESLEAFATVTWTRGSERQAGEREDAERIPPLFGRVGASGSLYSHWRMEAVFDFAARQDRLSSRDRADPRIDPRGTPGWSTLGLRLQRSWGERWQLTLDASNLLDRRYREHGSGVDAAGRGFGVGVGLQF